MDRAPAMNQLDTSYPGRVRPGAVPCPGRHSRKGKGRGRV